MARSKKNSAADGAGRLARASAFFATPVGGILGRALLTSVAILAVSLVVRQARAAVIRMPTYRIGTDDVVFVDLGAVVDASMRDGLVSSLPGSWPVEGPSMFAAGIETTVRDLLRGHPMVREVVDVELRYPRSIRARVAIRTPLAAFHVRYLGLDGRPADGVVPLDAEGIVLDPSVYASFLATKDVVRVDGIRSGCPAVGQRWIDSDEQVEEALAASRIANRLNAERSAIRCPRVEIVDVSGFPAPGNLRLRGEVILRLEDGRSIQWGRTERSSGSVAREDGYDVKRTRLIDLLSDPAAAKMPVLDVRFDRLRAREPVLRGR